MWYILVDPTTRIQPQEISESDLEQDSEGHSIIPDLAISWVSHTCIMVSSRQLLSKLQLSLDTAV